MTYNECFILFQIKPNITVRQLTLKCVFNTHFLNSVTAVRHAVFEQLNNLKLNNFCFEKAYA